MEQLPGNIFDDSTSVNPYTPDPAAAGQFQVPIDIDTSEGTDVHGKISSQFLDEVFEYSIGIGPSNGVNPLEPSTPLVPPTFTAALKTKLADLYWIGQLIEDLLERYEDCEDDDDIGDFCSAVVDILEDIRDDFVDKGITRDRLGKPLLCDFLAFPAPDLTLP